MLQRFNQAIKVIRALIKIYSEIYAIAYLPLI